MEPRPPDLSAAGTSDLSVTAGTGPWEGSEGRGRPRLKPGSRKNKPPTRLFGMGQPDSGAAGFRFAAHLAALRPIPPLPHLPARAPRLDAPAPGAPRGATEGRRKCS